ncbi:hypothetical protein C4J81_16995 [Deltaproteobacteria bacterium Smac51]|nr:hypothetical protein C4J81_16995 [Deltaproteobacteria bacterium Smac51]
MKPNRSPAKQKSLFLLGNGPPVQGKFDFYNSSRVGFSLKARLNHEPLKKKHQTGISGNMAAGAGGLNCL